MPFFVTANLKQPWARILLICTFLVPFCARALPPDQFHLRRPTLQNPPLGTSVFYKLQPSEGILGVSADLGFQANYFFGHDQSYIALVHVQSNALTVALSQFDKLFGIPARWTLGLDANKPLSYFAEAHLVFEVDQLEPFLGLRVQSTGFDISSEDSALFKSGAQNRFWLTSGSLGVLYRFTPHLILGTSLTFRHSFGETKFKDLGVFDVSMQWLWDTKNHD